MGERERNIGMNEALFRSVNEEIESLNRQMPGPGLMQIVCECGDPQCVERVPVDGDTYERTRKDPRRFLVATGHVVKDVEVVLEEHGAFQIIEKVHPEPEQIAEETDPRS